MDEELEDHIDIEAITFGWAGNTYQLKTWIFPLTDELRIEFPEVDFSKTGGAKPAFSKPTAVNAEHDSYIQIILHIGEEMLNWGLSKAFDGIAKKISETIRRTLVNKKYPGYCKVTTVYSDGTSVTVESSVETEQDADDLAVFISEAQEKSSVWLQHSKTTTKQLVYSIKGGSLTDKFTF